MSAAEKIFILSQSHFDLKISVLDEALYLITIIVHRISIVSFLSGYNILALCKFIWIFDIQIIMLLYVVLINLVSF